MMQLRSLETYLKQGGKLASVKHAAVFVNNVTRFGYNEYTYVALLS